MSDRQSPELSAYWWRKVPNFGDAINPVVIEALSGRRANWSDATGDNIACVGSIVSHAKPGWTIWGAGLISADCTIPSELKVLAVRGPLTQERMQNAGYDVPQVFGDPGLLMPIVEPFTSESSKHEWGIIPHFTEFDHPAIRPFAAQSKLQKFLGKLRGRNVICINPMAPVPTYLKQLSQCRKIAASSLHGLIMAEAYGKPAVWLQLADDSQTTRLMGGAFKFRDFYDGVGKSLPAPLVVKGSLDLEELNEVARPWQPMNWDPLPLLDAFPAKSAHWPRIRDRAANYFKKLANHSCVEVLR